MTGPAGPPPFSWQAYTPLAIPTMVKNQDDSSSQTFPVVHPGIHQGWCNPEVTLT